jgi:hypothetical protein
MQQFIPSVKLSLASFEVPACKILLLSALSIIHLSHYHCLRVVTTTIAINNLYSWLKKIVL